MIDGLQAAAFDALLARTGGVVLLIIDERLRILRAGAEAARLTERDVADLEGMSLIAAFGSAGLDAVCREAATSGQPRSGEAELGRAGSERAFAIEVVPIPHSGAFVVALRDVSTLRRVERVRRDFVANISHELRTPLASIKLLAETLNAGAIEDEATARDFVTQIERETDHLAQLVDELLDLSLIESGETTLVIEALDPDVVLNAVAGRIGPVAQRRGIGVVRSGPGEHRVRAAGDAGRLGQAILNLAHNAVKYSHPGGEVRLAWEPRRDRVRFTVADDGIGVPEAHRERIFERFYKVDRARARDPADEPAHETLGGSSGLGLAIVRHIAEAHRGAVGLESVDGRGSTFWIEVPVAGSAG